MFKRKRLAEYTLLCLGLLLFVVFMAKAFAQNVTQGYQSDSSLQPGMIVRLVAGNAGKIEPLTQSSETEMLGVVVASSEAPVSLSSDVTKQQTYVATSGQYDVLVSNQNGVIKNGDLVTISSLDGVGMKADAVHQVILGKAVETYDGTSAAQSTAELKTSGGSRTVTIGRIKVNIDVAHNPEYQPVTAEAGVPGWLASATQVVTDKPVGPARIYASLIIVLVCTLITGSLLYAGVRTSLTSIGRNPLARKSIVRNLLQVVLISLIIFTIGLIAVYLVLRI
ncbi:MAG TPA: hypothetical protein VFI74_04790 [Candidatus Saccharimonadales bacterium]|nr:hypothetical protein [Candidatus Saccharimonadales bacterium]